MEATHFRFAKDLSRKLRIKDFDSYYAGAIYPDSRYVTKINRKLTHGTDNPTDPFAPGLSDFEKGWATHNLYDVAARQHYLALSPWPEKKIEQGGQQWQYLTALKIIEDMDSYKHLGSDAQTIQDLSCTPPRNEDPDLLNDYYQIQKNLYSSEPTLDSYRKFWKGIEIKRETMENMLAYTEDVLGDEKKLEKVNQIYQQVLNNI